MNSLSVVEEKIIHKDTVEFNGILQKMIVIVDEFLLNGFVEPFNMGVHLGSAGIGMIVDEVEPPELFVKVFLEFRAVVGQNKRDGTREDLETEIKELFGRKRGMRGHRPSKRKSCVDVLKGDDVSAAAIHEPLDRVEGSQMARVQSFDILKLSQYFLTINLLHFPEMAELLREHPEAAQVNDEAADSGWLGAEQTLPLAEGQK